MAANWSRGLFRIWCVLSLCWIAFVAAEMGPNLWESTTLFSTREVWGYSFFVFTKSITAARVADIVVAALAVPAGILLGGAAIRWIAGGFRRHSN